MAKETSDLTKGKIAEIESEKTNEATDGGGDLNNRPPGRTVTDGDYYL